MSVSVHRERLARRVFRVNRKWRKWVFRSAAVLLGLSVFAVLELICWAAGWGTDDIKEDPFVGFTSIRPLFAPAPDGVNYHTATARRRFFRQDSFALRKPEGEFRIFVFGGSTVQGNPFSIETSFPTYLQIALQKADPDRQWKVVNCGGVSYATYRLLPIMQECLSYEPDLCIFCGGHNEFLEDVSYAHVKTSLPILPQTYSVLSHFRSFRLLCDFIQSRPEDREQPSSAEGMSAKPTLGTEVDTLLDHEGGLAVYHRDDDHSAAVVQHFGNNLQRMVRLCRSGNIPLLMILPPSNLSDCPPFKSEFTASLSGKQTARIQELLKESRTLARSDVSQAIDRLHEVTTLDPRFAFGWYELGQLQLAAGQSAEAETSLRRARDEDICPLRMTTPLESAMQEVVRKAAIPFINAHELLSSRSPNGIIGENVLVDHVHPSFRGHEDIAIAIAEWMLSANFARSRNSDWAEATRAECRLRLQSLDDLYFLRGQRALENLRLWAAGRSGGPPLSRKP